MSGAAKAAITVEVGGIEVLFDPVLFDPVLFDTTGPDWTDVSADLVSAAGFAIKYGIDGNDPGAVMASVGECAFTLNNMANNSGHVQGYYSPRHPSRRIGWALSLPVRVTLTYNGVPRVKHRGTIASISPTPGRYARQQVEVVSYDSIYQLMEAEASAIPLQENKTESELMTAVFAAIPEHARPVSVDLDAGLDTFPVAFDTAVKGTKALGVLRDCTLSALGMAFVTGDGTFRYLTRHAKALAATILTLADTMADVDVPTAVERLYNTFRVTVHPKSVSATPTDLLYTLPPGPATIEIPPGESIDVWADYSDPNDRTAPVGGIGVVTALVPVTHYAANRLADGSGADATASVTPTLSPFATKGKVTLTNTGSVSAFLTTLKLYGKAVRDPGAQTAEVTSEQLYGERVMAIDLPFQDDLFVGQDMASYLAGAYASVVDAADTVVLAANTDPALMVAALAAEPGDAIVLTETVSGITGLKALIMSVGLAFNANGMLTCQWGLAPASTGVMWQWGVAGLSEWGETTVYGF